MQEFTAFFNGEWVPYSEVKIDPVRQGFPHGRLHIRRRAHVRRQDIPAACAHGAAVPLAPVHAHRPGPDAGRDGGGNGRSGAQEREPAATRRRLVGKAGGHARAVALIQPGPARRKPRLANGHSIPRCPSTYGGHARYYEEGAAVVFPTARSYSAELRWTRRRSTTAGPTSCRRSCRQPTSTPTHSPCCSTRTATSRRTLGATS